MNQLIVGEDHKNLEPLHFSTLLMFLLFSVNLAGNQTTMRTTLMKSILTDAMQRKVVKPRCRSSNVLSQRHRQSTRQSRK